MEELLIITAIEPQKRKKDRYNIYADGEYVASLGAEAIVKAGIRAGAPSSQKALDDAVLADNVQYAFDSAVGLLAHGMRTRGELEQRLRGRGIADEAIAPADGLTAEHRVDRGASEHVVQRRHPPQHLLDGLVHVSQLADRFVKDPHEVVKAGDVVKVRVVAVLSLIHISEPTRPY